MKMKHKSYWLTESAFRLYRTITFPFTPTTMAFQSISGKGDTNSSSKFLSRWVHIALICRYANGSPRHPCLPPPKEIYENAPATLSSSLPTENLSGSYLSGSLKMWPSLLAKAGDVAIIWPLGMSYSFPSRVVTLKSLCELLSSMIRGGWSLKASLMHLYNTSISAKTSWSTLSPCFSINCFCSSCTAERYWLLHSRYAPVQVEVIELVCWPAKRAAMRSPVTSASVVGRPSLYFESMKHCSMSSSVLPALLREDMMVAKISASFLRAWSRRLWAGIGRYGKSTLIGSIPLSRSWNNAETSSKSLSRTSRPKRHLLAVKMIRCSSSYFKSTSPLGPHFEK